MIFSKLIFWRKKKTPEEKVVTMFGCPGKAELVQKEIDDAHEKSEMATIDVKRAMTVFDLDCGKLSLQSGQESVE